MKSGEDALQCLLTRSLDGDEAAYGEFLTQLGEVLRGYIRRQLYRVGRAEHDAEDLVQEALLAVHSKWHTYDRSLPVTAWARTIARYKLIDFLRVRHADSHDLSLDQVEEASTGDSDAVDAAISVRTLIAALPAKMGIAIELIRLKGLSVKEAAAVSGMSEAAIKVNVHRGVKSLSKMYS